MKKLSLLTLTIASAIQLWGQNVYTDRRDGEIYVKFKDDFKINVPLDDAGYLPKESLTAVRPFMEKYGVTAVQRSFYFAPQISLFQTFRVYFNDAEQVDFFIKELEGLAIVDYAEHVPLLKTTLTPNDMGANSFNNGNWSLFKISAQTAWDISTGNTNIKVAVVDDAVQATHPDLSPNCVAGRDVALGNNNPNPPNTNYSHGTHVAGIVSAATNNGVGIASIGYSVKIIPVKATNSESNISHGYEGVTWAANNGADVINMSWGGTFGGQTAANVINAAYNAGVTLVAAAGNDNVETVFYPAGFTNVISVASTTNNDGKSSFSNYGTWIDIAAPGSQIRSTVPNNTYGIMSGTSMASPLVAGLCGLVLSVNPNFTPSQVENCIRSSADNINSANASYIGKLGSGRINARAAVVCAQGSTVAYDAGIQSITTPAGTTCQTSFTPRVVLKNFGAQTLTSATITYRVDNGTNQNFNWTGSIAGGGTANVNLPTVTTTSGAHTFTASTGTTLNGNQTDANANNNSTQSTFTVLSSAGISLPFSENFETNTFTTNNWGIENSDNNLTWEIVTTAGNTPGNKSARIPFYSYQTTGQRDGLVTPPLNLTGYTSVTLTFDHAYRRYNQSSTDSMIIYVSTDCGVTYQRIFSRGENGTGTFATVATSTTDFFPQVADDWCFSGTVGSACYTINLNAYIGNPSVRIKFEGYNNYGNNLYIDNINISGVIANAPPTAAFIADNRNVCQGSSVSFTNQSTNQPTSYSWSFPGGTPSTSTATNPSVTYSTPGTYQVSLTATNSFGNNTSTQASFITVNATPNVTGTANPNPVCDGDTTFLIGSGASTYLWVNGLSQMTGNNIPVQPSSNITYNLTGTSVQGCSKTISVPITVNQAPVAPIITAVANVLSVAPVYTTYQWYLNGNLIQGATASSYTASQSGTYTCVVTNSSGCSASDDIVFSNLSTTENELGIQVYPNPAIDLVNVTFNNTTSEVSILMTDITGRVVLNTTSMPVLNNLLQLPVSQLAAGTYVLSIRVNSQLYPFVIIKQ